MRYKKLIPQIISLILIIFLLSSFLYAWFSESKTANTSNIEITSESFKINNASLEIYDETTKNFKEFSEDSLSNILPGTQIYFRLKINVSNEMKINVSFKDISSSLVKPVIVSDGKILVADYPMEEYNVSNKIINGIEYSCVIVDDKILYIEDNEKSMSLYDYKIEDVFQAYELGTNLPGFTIPDTLNDGVKIKEYKGSASLNIGNNYYYFALEYSESLSLVLGNSNCYQYQNLKIGKIALTKDDTIWKRWYYL